MRGQQELEKTQRDQESKMEGIEYSHSMDQN